MIAVDSSALVAIVLGEAELNEFAAIIARQPSALAAANLTEAALVLEARQGPDAVEELRRLLDRAQVQVESVDAELAWAAHAAWRRFGKGHHPANLNYGDCFAYALAKSLAAPLLYKGDDFAQTDIERAQ